ncbi:MAG: hypothetical protein M3P96_05710 [Actinomycetota bacterium]|nr:hypothetical protein [Actinomycetota bacterium]
MCRRYVSARPTLQLRARFAAVDETGGQRADFNVASTKPVPAILVRGEPVEPGGERPEARHVLRLLRWGLSTN